MAEWIYRATTEGADLEATTEILEDGFFVRTAHRTGGGKIANAHQVASGDILHAFYRGDRHCEYLGSFRVVRGQSDDLRALGSTPMRRVVSGSALDARLRAAGYTEDPEEGCITGWALEEDEPRAFGDLNRVFASLGQNALFRFEPNSDEIVTGTRRVSVAPADEAPHAATVVSPKTAEPGARFVGIDWSGGANAGKKIWAAYIAASGDGLVLEDVHRPFHEIPDRASVRARFADWVTRTSATAFGFDFCFGVSRRQLPALRAALGAAFRPKASPVELGALIAKHFPTAEAFRAACGPEAKRDTDKLRRSPFAPTNLRMYRQTWFGLSCLGTLSEQAVPPWSMGERAIVEVLPALLARGFKVRSYKGESLDARAARETLLDEIQARMAITKMQRAMLVEDTEADAIDAVLAALAVAAAHSSGFGGAPPSALDEGWIF